MFYKHIPQPTEELFSLDDFVREGSMPKTPGLSKDVKICQNVMVAAEDLYDSNGRLAGVLIFVPYLNKQAIEWPVR